MTMSIQEQNRNLENDFCKGASQKLGAHPKVLFKLAWLMILSIHLKKQSVLVDMKVITQKHQCWEFI